MLKESLGILYQKSRHFMDRETKAHAWFVQSHTDDTLTSLRRNQQKG